MIKEYMVFKVLTFILKQIISENISYQNTSFLRLKNMYAAMVHKQWIRLNLFAMIYISIALYLRF